MVSKHTKRAKNMINYQLTTNRLVFMGRVCVIVFFSPVAPFPGKLINDSSKFNVFAFFFAAACSLFTVCPRNDIGMILSFEPGQPNQVDGRLKRSLRCLGAYKCLDYSVYMICHFSDQRSSAAALQTSMLWAGTPGLRLTLAPLCWPVSNT